MPAPKFAPTGPSTTTVPPVMYSQPWGPTPSTTASAPLFRTANRIPARPTRWRRPSVAPYRTVFPAIAWPARDGDGGPEVGRRAADRTQDAATLADHLADRTGPDRGELVPQVLRERRHESLDLLRRAGELGAEVVALGGDPRRTGIEVALPGHVAADGHERGGPERELLGAEEC